jgi:hypothetical protein
MGFYAGTASLDPQAAPDPGQRYNLAASTIQVAIS